MKESSLELGRLCALPPYFFEQGGWSPPCPPCSYAPAEQLRNVTKNVFFFTRYYVVLWLLCTSRSMSNQETSCHLKVNLKPQPCEKQLVTIVREEASLSHNDN